MKKCEFCLDTSGTGDREYDLSCVRIGKFKSFNEDVELMVGINYVKKHVLSLWNNNHVEGMQMHLPVKYCPMCGRKL